MPHLSRSPTSNRLKLQAAFTLVELSVVLVIIGLLVGGVLAAQDMIRAAQTRSVITDLQKYQTSIGLFKDKYDRLPGDMPNATDFWSGTSNGDGDHKIGNQGLEDATENVAAWQHLSLAGMISGSYSQASPTSSYHFPGINVPAATIEGGAWNFIPLMTVTTSESGAKAGFFSGDYGNAISISGKDVSVNYIGVSPVLTTQEAYSIDKKIDDGEVAQGSVRGMRPVTSLSVPQDCATSTNPGTAEYKLTMEGVQCSLIFKTNY